MVYRLISNKWNGNKTDKYIKTAKTTNDDGRHIWEIGTMLKAL